MNSKRFIAPSTFGPKIHRNSMLPRQVQDPAVHEHRGEERQRGGRVARHPGRAAVARERAVGDRVGDGAVVVSTAWLGPLRPACSTRK